MLLQSGEDLVSFGELNPSGVPAATGLQNGSVTDLWLCDHALILAGGLLHVSTSAYLLVARPHNWPGQQHSINCCLSQLNLCENAAAPSTRSILHQIELSTCSAHLARALQQEL